MRYLIIFFFLVFHLIGCSDKNLVESNWVDPKALSLLEANEGKSIITGLLYYTPHDSICGTLVSNASGKNIVNPNVSKPLICDIQFYLEGDSSTDATYSTQSDSTGKFYAILDEGYHYGHFFTIDRVTLCLIDGRINTFLAIKDSIINLGVIFAD